MTATQIRTRMDRLLGTSDTNYSVSDKTVDMNEAISQIVSVIFMNDKRWQFDDFNHGDLNIFFTPLVDGQQDYEVSGVDFLTINEVAVKRSDGTYKVLEKITREGGVKQRLADSEDGDSGIPTHYELMGNSVFLYPKPDLSKLIALNGLRVTGKRLPSFFTTADTTKQPGFNPLFHKAVPYLASLEYAYDNEMSSKINILEPKSQQLLQAIGESYAKRATDEQMVATPHQEEYGNNTMLI